MRPSLAVKKGSDCAVLRRARSRLRVVAALLVWVSVPWACDAQDRVNVDVQSLDKTPMRVFLKQMKLLKVSGTGITVITSDEEILKVRQPLANNVYPLIGKRLGVATMTVAASGEIHSYVVNVIRDPQQFLELQEFINKSFPGSAVVIEPTPDTTKIVLQGTVPDEWTLAQVRSLVVSKEFPQSAIIDRLTVPCTYCNYCAQGPWRFRRW